MRETWRPVRASRMYRVPGGVFEGSTEGRLRKHGVVLDPWLDSDGYPTVKCGRRNVPVHLLIELAFAGEPEVLHLDGDKRNSRPGNLGWGSRVGNEQGPKGKGERRKKGSVTVPASAVTPVTGDLR